MSLLGIQKAFGKRENSLFTVTRQILLYLESGKTVCLRSQGRYFYIWKAEKQSVYGHKADTFIFGKRKNSLFTVARQIFLYLENGKTVCLRSQGRYFYKMKQDKCFTVVVELASNDLGNPIARVYDPVFYLNYKYIF